MKPDQLWTRYHRDRDDDTRNRLLDHYHFIADQTARSMSKLMTPADREDVRGEAVLGLIRAIETWDPSKTQCWEKYARFRCKATTVDALRASGWVHKSTRNEARRLSDAEEALVSVHGRKPTEEEVAVLLAITVDSLAEIRSKASGTQWVVTSLDSPVAGEPMLSFHDIVGDPSQTPEQSALAHEQHQHLAGVLDRLSPIHQDVLRRKYMGGERGGDIAKALGVHPSRVSQLEDAALLAAREISHQRVLPL